MNRIPRGTSTMPTPRRFGLYLKGFFLQSFCQNNVNQGDGIFQRIHDLNHCATEIMNGLWQGAFRLRAAAAAFAFGAAMHDLY